MRVHFRPPTSAANPEARRTNRTPARLATLAACAVLSALGFTRNGLCQTYIWMTPQYSTYTNTSVSGSYIYTSVTVDGYTSGTCPVMPASLANECHVTTHTPKVYNTIGGVGGWENGSAVYWSSYLSMTNHQQIEAAPGNEVNFSWEGLVWCSALGGAIFSHSGNNGIVGPPKILMGGCSGTDITGQTESVVTGQQIALCAEYSLSGGTTLASQSWSVPGTTVGGFNAGTSGGYTGTTFNQESTTFYWLAPGGSLRVLFTLNLTDGASASTVATFNVAGPTGVSATASLGHWEILGGDMLALGSNTVGDLGIQINAGATSPSGEQGTYEWAQIISEDSLTFTAADGTKTSCSYGKGLDTRFPANTGLGFSDNPSTGFNTSYEGQAWTLNFAAYLMWQPGLASAIPVPLGHVSWGAYGDAAYANGAWTVQSDSSANAGAFQSGSSFSGWTRVIDQNTPCQ
jgi:hypothetical protein